MAGPRSPDPAPLSGIAHGPPPVSHTTRNPPSQRQFRRTATTHHRSVPERPPQNPSYQRAQSHPNYRQSQTRVSPSADVRYLQNGEPRGRAGGALCHTNQLTRPRTQPCRATSANLQVRAAQTTCTALNIWAAACPTGSDTLPSWSPMMSAKAETSAALSQLVFSHFCSRRRFKRIAAHTTTVKPKTTRAEYCEDANFIKNIDKPTLHNTKPTIRMGCLYFIITISHSECVLLLLELRGRRLKRIMVGMSPTPFIIRIIWFCIYTTQRRIDDILRVPSPQDTLPREQERIERDHSIFAAQLGNP